MSKRPSDIDENKEVPNKKKDLEVSTVQIMALNVGAVESRPAMPNLFE